MDEPPFLLDGALVLRHATVAPAPAGPRSVVAAGVSMDLDTLARLAIVQDLARDGVYLLHCNDRFETLAAERFATAQDAAESAGRDYAGIAVAWQDFRALTPEESRELEQTRAFLRQLASGALDL